MDCAAPQQWRRWRRMNQGNWREGRLRTYGGRGEGIIRGGFGCLLPCLAPSAGGGLCSVMDAHSLELEGRTFSLPPAILGGMQHTTPTRDEQICAALRLAADETILPTPLGLKNID